MMLLPLSPEEATLFPGRSYGSFQEIGGDSIMATRIIARLKDSLQVQLDLRDLFSAGTVAEMARLLEAELINRIDELSDEDARAMCVR